MSIIVAMVGVPALAARDPDERRGVRKMLLLLLVANALYLAYVALVHPAIDVPRRW